MMKTQRCDLCDEPTGRCEDDTIRLPSDTVVCPDCWDRSVQGWPSTGSLERFDLVKASSGDYHHDHIMEPCKTGEWIRYEDAADAIRTAKLDTLRALVPEVVKPKEFKPPCGQGCSEPGQDGCCMREPRDLCQHTIEYQEGRTETCSLCGESSVYLHKPKFDNVSCSNCGRSFGPGDHGFSHCKNHKGMFGTR